MLTLSPPAVFWGICTMLTACAKTVQHVYVIKFFQGVAEGSTFVGAVSVPLRSLVSRSMRRATPLTPLQHYLMGSWYKETELGKRAAVFSASAQAATLFSGVLQASIYMNLNGHAGLAGWVRRRELGPRRGMGADLLWICSNGCLSFVGR